jgi:hypothetical protein
MSLENLNDDKVKCPFCGFEVDKGAKRCENCASILKKEEKDFADFTDNTEDNVSSESITEKNETFEVQAEKAYQSKQNYIPYNNAYNANTIVPQAPKQLSNGFKVAFTAICVMVPIIGQFLGLILSIIYMNSDEELRDCEDRRSFGLALLIACVIAFMVSVFWCFVTIIVAAKIL